MTLDARADLLRRQAAEALGRRPEALLPFDVLTDPEKQMWRDRALGRPLCPKRS